MVKNKDLEDYFMRNSAIKIILPLFFIIYLLILFTGCSQQKTASIRVAYVEASSNLPLFVAIERGYFDKYGVKVYLIKSVNSSEALNLLAANRVDVSIENNFNTIYSLSGKNPDLLKIIQPCYETKAHPISHLLVKKDSKITNVSDLRGKTIGTFSGSSQLLVLQLYLKNKLRLDPNKDVSIIQVEMNLQIPALTAGQFDALFTVEPYSTIAIANNQAISIDDYVRGEIMDPFPAGGTSVSGFALKNKKKDLLNFISAIDMAINDINIEGQKINSILPKYTPIEKDIALQCQVYLFKTFNETNDQDEQLALKLIKLYIDANIIPASSLVSGLFLIQR